MIDPAEFKHGDRIAITFASGDWTRPIVERPLETELDGSTKRLVTSTGTLRWHPHGPVTFFWRPAPGESGAYDIQGARSVDRA